MANKKSLRQRSKTSSSWLAVAGGCVLTITAVCSLVLGVLLLASAAFNVYLAWSLSGYEVSVGQPTSTASALVLVTPTGVLAIIPTPTAAPTSTSLPAATTAPTSTSTLAPTQAPTSAPSPTATQTEPATATATATQVGNAEQGGAGSEGGSSAPDVPMSVAAGTSKSSAPPASETIAYVVQEGDTLWLIADTAYRSGPLWEVIYEENRDVLENPNQIQPGQVLRIPLNP
jgi:nucleoid-associated protein YgaU